MHVIGTAGHVDHGKSTLVNALTGTNPDRLKEEQEREMTIDLGFAWFIMPDGEEIGIVDVPGHRDFIDNMLAGVGGIDAALLIIAADEGIMPQTREHLAILDLLQIHSGLVVLTKIDLVEDPEWLELVELDIRKLLNGTAFQNAPIHRVSSVTRAGLPELVQGLSILLKDCPTRTDLGRPRLPVDRIFTIAGFGTVVTGTLADGHLTCGDEVEILPSGLRGRIRGLQTHKKNEENAKPGSRTAVNISGLNVKQFRRGDVVTTPGQYKSSQRLDLSLRILPTVSSPLRHHTEVKFYIGTSETVGEVRLLGSELLNPGENGWLQLDLRTPVVAMRGDRFILRLPSPAETIGGGTVVDPHPKGRHKRFDDKVLQTLYVMAAGSPAMVLLQSSIAMGPAPVKEVISHSKLGIPEAQIAMRDLAVSGQCLILEDLIIANTQWENIEEETKKTLSSYHQAYPLRHGMPREELKSRLKLATRTFNLIMARMGSEGTLVENSKWVSLPEHKVVFSPSQQANVDKLLESFAAVPTTPPTIKECQVLVGEDVYDVLRDSGELVAVSSEIVFRKTDFDRMVNLIQQLLHAKGQISMGEVRDLLKTSRKYAQPFLEYLDLIGMTIREGDIRRFRSQE